MSRIFHLAAAGVLAAFAAASLFGLAFAAPDKDARETVCDKAICLMALF